MEKNEFKRKFICGEQDMMENMKRKITKKRCALLLIVLLVLIMLIALLYYLRHENKDYTITQYGLDDNSQAMFYIIESPDGHLVVIDGGTKGYAEYVRQILAQKGNKVDAWILTHAHEDHMGAFVDIMESPQGISVSKVYMSDIDYEYYASVAQPVDRFDIYEEFLNLHLSNITYLHAGDKLDLIGLSMEIYNAYSDEHKNGIITGNMMNETSLVFKLTNQKESMLFCSDTGDPSVHKKLISEYGDKLKADYMQVGHHGAGYGEEFFSVVGAKTLFVDAPKSLRDWTDYPVYGNLNLFKEQGYTVYTYETVPNTIMLR